jgi:C4-type Zn-finger protein
MLKSNNSLEVAELGKVANFLEVIKDLKHQKITEKTIKLCPKCQSNRIEITSGFDTYPRLFGITPSKYVCKNCGYSGPIVLEQTIKENKRDEV